MVSRSSAHDLSFQEQAIQRAAGRRRTGAADRAIAPTGNKIAFQSSGELFIASATGPATELNQVGLSPLTVEEMVWSHNGRVLAFTETDDAQVPRRGIPDYLGPEAALRMVKRAFPGEPSARRRFIANRTIGKRIVRLLQAFAPIHEQPHIVDEARLAFLENFVR